MIQFSFWSKSISMSVCSHGKWTQVILNGGIGRRENLAGGEALCGAACVGVLSQEWW